MLILALETSTEMGSCALWRDGEAIERRCPTGVPHSETLLPLIKDLLVEADVRLRDLAGIAFGVGPGAFTGLRVACGAAQGLAVAADLTLLPVTSLETMAAQCDREHVLALLDARMGEVYSGYFERDGGRLVQRGDIRVSTPNAVMFPERGDWLACGNAIAAYPALATRLQDHGVEQRGDIVPTAAVLAAIAAPRLLRGEGIDAALAAPLYVRDKVAKTVAERLIEGGRA